MKVMSKLGVLENEGVGQISLNVGGSVNVNNGSYFIDGIDVVLLLRPVGHIYQVLGQDIVLTTSNTFIEALSIDIDEPGFYLVHGTAVFAQFATEVRLFEAQLAADGGGVIAAGSGIVPSNNPAYCTVTLVGFVGVPSRDRIYLSGATNVGGLDARISTRNAISMNTGTMLSIWKMEDWTKKED